MLPDYADIRELTSRPPEWFDGRGVPRYAPFAPQMLGVYDTYAVLYLIACQDCRQRFYVGEGYKDIDFQGGKVERFAPSLEWVQGLHYGDPPRHDCVGDTMNCDDLRVVEFWRKDCSCAEVHVEGCGRWDWRRDQALEIVLQDGE